MLGGLKGSFVEFGFYFVYNERLWSKGVIVRFVF